MGLHSCNPQALGGTPYGQPWVEGSQDAKRAHHQFTESGDTKAGVARRRERGKHQEESGQGPTRPARATGGQKEGAWGLARLGGQGYLALRGALGADEERHHSPHPQCTSWEGEGSL